MLTCFIHFRDRGKIFNKKPSNPEDEFVPKKVQNMMQLADRVANGEKVHKKPRRKKHLSNGYVRKAFSERSGHA